MALRVIACNLSVIRFDGGVYWAPLRTIISFDEAPFVFRIWKTSHLRVKVWELHSIVHSYAMAPMSSECSFWHSMAVFEGMIPGLHICTTFICKRKNMEKQVLGFGRPGCLRKNKEPQTIRHPRCRLLCGNSRRTISSFWRSDSFEMRSRHFKYRWKWSAP